MDLPEVRKLLVANAKDIKGTHWKSKENIHD